MRVLRSNPWASAPYLLLLTPCTLQVKRKLWKMNADLFSAFSTNWLWRLNMLNTTEAWQAVGLFMLKSPSKSFPPKKPSKAFDQPGCEGACLRICRPQEGETPCLICFLLVLRVLDRSLALKGLRFFISSWLFWEFGPSESWFQMVSGLKGFFATEILHSGHWCASSFGFPLAKPDVRSI